MTRSIEVSNGVRRERWISRRVSELIFMGVIKVAKESGEWLMAVIYRQRTHLKIGIGGEAVVDAGGRLAESGGGVAFGEPAGEFGAETRLMLDEFVMSCFGEMDLGWAREERGARLPMAAITRGESRRHSTSRRSVGMPR